MNAQKNIPEILRDVKFLEGLSDEQYDLLAPLCRVVDFPAHKTIFQQYEQKTEMYFIISGKVSVAICGPKVGCRQITEVNDGDLLGWSPLLKRPRLSAAAYTLTPTKAAAIDGDALLTLCQENPEFGFELMRRTADVLAQRLTATRTQLLDLSGPHLREVAIESD